VNFSPVNPEFKRGKDVHHLVDQQFGYAAPLLDLGISIEFSGAITTRFSFTYTLEGVTAMLRGLHARLCHAVVVFSLECIACSAAVCSFCLLRSHISQEMKITQNVHSTRLADKSADVFPSVTDTS